MIDLSYKPKKKQEEKEDTPLIFVAFAVLPFVVLFYIVLTKAFLLGIY